MTNSIKNDTNTEKIKKLTLKYGLAIAILTPFIIFVSTSFTNLCTDYFMSGYLDYFNIVLNFKVPLDISLNSLQIVAFSNILLIVSIIIILLIIIYSFNHPFGFIGKWKSEASSKCCTFLLNVLDFPNKMFFNIHFKSYNSNSCCMYNFFQCKFRIFNP